MKAYSPEPIRYINDVSEMPENARYILRPLSDFSINLVLYSNGIQIILKAFPCESYWHINFFRTLCLCRDIIGTNEIFWVEKPKWMYE